MLAGLVAAVFVGVVIELIEQEKKIELIAQKDNAIFNRLDVIQGQIMMQCAKPEKNKLDPMPVNVKQKNVKHPNCPPEASEK
jgi:hypothetical protein